MFKAFDRVAKERLRRDQSQPSSFKLIISFTVSPSFRRRRCCVPGRTRLGATDGPFVDVYTLFLVFILEHEKVREKQEKRELEQDVIVE